MFCPPPRELDNKRPFQLTAIAAILSTLTFPAFAESVVFDENNPWTTGETGYIDQQQSVSEQTIKFDGSNYLYEGGDNLYLVTGSQLDGFTASSNIFELIGGKNHFDNFVAIKSTESDNAVFLSNSMTVDGGDFSRNGLNLIRVEKSENVQIKNNKLVAENVMASGDSGYSVGLVYMPTALSGDKRKGVSGTVENNYLEVSHSEVNNIYAIYGYRGDTQNTLSIQHNTTKVIDTKFKTAYSVTLQSGAAELANNTLILDSSTIDALKDSARAVAQYIATPSNKTEKISKGHLVIQNSLSVLSDTNQRVDLAGSYTLSQAEVDGSTVSIEDLKSFDAEDGLILYIYGGYAGSAQASGNSVTIENSNLISTRTHQIYGAVTKGDAQSNSVSISNSQVKAQLWGAQSDGDAIDNSVTLVNSVVQGDIYGTSSKGVANGTRITINNSTVKGTIALYNRSSKATELSGGSIEIIGNANLADAQIQVSNTSKQALSDNRLVFNNWTGTVKGLGYVDYKNETYTFDHLSFTNIAWSDGQTILTSLGNPDEMGTYTVINGAALDDNSLLFTSAPSMQKDESMTIIHADHGITYTDDATLGTEKALKGNAGTATEFEGTLSYGENDVVFTVDGVKRADQTTLVGDSRIAAAAFVNQSTDLLEHVFDGFRYDGHYGLSTFAAAEGNKSQYDIDSNLKINGWNFIAGLRHTAKLDSGDLTSAVFFENGNGNYRTWNEFLGERFRASGELLYNGGGVASRYSLYSGLYAEGSLRVGQLRIDMSNALRDTSGNSWDFDSQSLYIGAHLGGGYFANLSDSISVDFFGKYFYAYTQSDDFSVLDEKYKFSDINSHRVRIGAQLNYEKDNVMLYTGLAAEYEFDGESEMRAASTQAFSSEIDGFSAIGSLGVRLKPTAASPWLFDFNVKGWEGERDSITGSVTLNYLF